MRYLQPFIQKDLSRKMVLLGGPRQSGKTTLAQSLLASTQGRYFNWDLDEDRRALIAKQWSDSEQLLLFDELHKYTRWKNWLKGIYDTQKTKHSFLVTGSARLDIYKKGGDSLLGRYHYWRLHPFTLSELPAGISKQTAFDRLMTVGGFPEPFLDGNEREAARWRRERIDRVIKDDIRELEGLKDLSSLGLLVDLLRTRVGGPIVVSNLASDLQKSPKTILAWIEALERMYLIFRVRSHAEKLPRLMQKQFKVYFYDTGDVLGDTGARFENLVANHLLKRLHFSEDYEGKRLELCFLRDKEGHEVDFAIIDRSHGKAVVTELIEAKWTDVTLSSGLAYFSPRFKPMRSLQLVAKPKKEHRLTSQGNIHVLDAIPELVRAPWV